MTKASVGHNRGFFNVRYPKSFTVWYPQKRYQFFNNVVAFLLTRSSAAERAPDKGEVIGSNPVVSTNLSLSSSGKDARPSTWRQGFESPWGHQMICRWQSGMQRSPKSCSYELCGFESHPACQIGGWSNRSRVGPLRNPLCTSWALASPPHCKCDVNPCVGSTPTSCTK